jgi:hypothetical protein
VEAFDTTRGYVMQQGSKERHTVGITMWLSEAVTTTVVKADGSYWIPGSSSVKFVVTDCLYRLYTRVVTDAASLKKAL